MASLVLLLSEILRHETIDNLIATPPPSSSATAPPPSATTPVRSLPSGCRNTGQDQFQDDLPRVCVDLVWP
ncbi:UNVERIFIED_CONTAM: hypothetical protein Sangu_2358300 [Sesamum angustifolium]|uniref:Uncharacterized protein n=1 Tax=Sesamum angustifolium TaxID=2727405 RepID=A0AAW2KUE0_9LAMI